MTANPDSHSAQPRSVDDHDPRAGAHNLLQNCLSATRGEKLLIVGELLGVGYYDDCVCDFVAGEARAQGIETDVLRVPTAAGPNDIPDSVVAAMRRADHTVFFARLGDQMRFTEMHGAGSKTMCYPLDLEYLGSEFGRTHWGLFDQVNKRLTAAMMAASSYRITCPLGTSLAGDIPRGESTQRVVTAFTIKFFPVAIFPPINCSNLSGRMVLDRFLMSTTIKSFENSILPLRTPVIARIENSRIVGFDGDSDTVRKVEAQYRRVGALDGGDPLAVNSWHAGIYPKTFYSADPKANIQRWGDLAFASPRYLHFHTCGIAPGNIATATFDATIRFDDEIFWDAGKLVFLDRPELKALLDQYSGTADNYQMRWDIGI